MSGSNITSTPIVLPNPMSNHPTDPCATTLLEMMLLILNPRRLPKYLRPRASVAVNAMSVSHVGMKEKIHKTIEAYKLNEPSIKSSTSVVPIGIKCVAIHVYAVSSPYSDLLNLTISNVLRGCRMVIHQVCISDLKLGFCCHGVPTRRSGSDSLMGLPHSGQGREWSRSSMM